MRADTLASTRSRRPPGGHDRKHGTEVMIGRQRFSAPRPTRLAGVAVTAAALSMGALGLAGMAYAQPAPPAEPGVPPPPGQPVFQPVAGGDAPPAAPPPVGPPMVPEIQNPGYGQNSSGGGGTLAFLREAWNMAQDPYGFTQIPPEGLPTSAPPPGAGPPPPLPPGYQSLNAPGSETPLPEADPSAVAPPLPPGYYPLNGPPPPGYFDPPPPDPMNPFGSVTPIPAP